LDKDFDDKVGLGMGTAMAVVEPREKELPKEPVTMGRNRSGTGKSSKDKKSVFGVLSGEHQPLPGASWAHDRTVDEQHESASYLHTV
jgi:p21-activated kinase 1